MRRQEKRYLRYLPDTNLFIAAIKTPNRETGSLALLLKLLEDEKIELVADRYLIYELDRYSEVFPSPTSKLLLTLLRSKISTINPQKEHLIKCRPHIPETEAGDLTHAATCLQTEATLITNGFCLI
jgi:predicted nucleic acid-binding protein